MSFEGRVALVTGSTRGIGWAVAELLAERGATVVLNGASNAERLEARVAELRERFGREHGGELADVGEPAAATGLVKTVFSSHRRLDVLVNNAGVYPTEGVFSVSEETFVMGLCRLTRSDRLGPVRHSCR